MNLRDAETGKVLWQGTEDLSVPGVEHEGTQALSQPDSDTQVSTRASQEQCLLKRHVPVICSYKGHVKLQLIIGLTAYAAAVSV